MSVFRTTQDIFKGGVYFDPNWLDRPYYQGIPPAEKWSNDREMQIEDVDFWEVISEGGGGMGVYASYSPYAEFYLVIHNFGKDMETFYGPTANKRCEEYLIKHKIRYPKR